MTRSVNWTVTDVYVAVHCLTEMSTAPVWSKNNGSGVDTSLTSDWLDQNKTCPLPKMNILV